MTLANPYTSLPDHAFWKKAVANRRPREINGLWTPQFEIKKDHLIATAG